MEIPDLLELVPATSSSPHVQRFHIVLLLVLLLKDILPELTLVALLAVVGRSL
jgi:hypothetical protein